MANELILMGDVNLMDVRDPSVPFARVAETLAQADLRFANLECCLHLPSSGHSTEAEGFFADPAPAGAALRFAGIDAVGLANNVNYGAAAIMGSIANLDALGIAHTGAGANLAAARAPAILERQGVRFGFLQRSSVYWPTGHEAAADMTGIAVIRGHTAYQVPLHKTRPEIPPMNRPGVPPVILTWADPQYLAAFAEDIAALRPRVDLLVASCHWGLGREVLHYMREIAHEAIEAGADLVVGHGPHYALPVEIYRGRPIFYGLGSFSFHTGHGGRRHGDWLGMLARVRLGGGEAQAAFRFVRHNERNETILRGPEEEAASFAEIARESRALSAGLEIRGGDAWVSAIAA
ncbi:MAG TPA: CapA family protein [Stellaceae bacterium]|nr:CapA family protein [Stellaceae bacterium]